VDAWKYSNIYVYVRECVCVHALLTPRARSRLTLRASSWRLPTIQLFVCQLRGYSRVMHWATHCNTLQHTATHCNTLQHTATHCNTLQQTRSLDIYLYIYSRVMHSCVCTNNLFVTSRVNTCVYVYGYMCMCVCVCVCMLHFFEGEIVW